MGDWNHMCAVSLTPVKPKNKVKLFFIGSSRGEYLSEAKYSTISNGAKCNYYDDFQIVGGIGISATYDGYGRYKIASNTIEAKHLLNEIRKYYFPNDEQAKHVNEKFIGIKPEDLNFTNILEMINNGVFYLKSYSAQVLDFLNIMVIHEDIYQMLINEKTTLFNASKLSYDDLSLEDILSKGEKKFLDWESGSEKKIADMIANYSDYLKTSLSMEDLHEIALNTLLSIDPPFPDYEKFYSFRRCNTLFQLLKLQPKFKKETKNGVIRKAVEWVHFSHKLDQHNIMIRPSMTLPDDFSAQEQIDFYKKMIDVIQKSKIK